MLAYAADTPKTAGRDRSPKALTLIIAGHALVLAGVLTAKPELVGIGPQKPTTVINIANDPPKPRPQPVERQERPRPATHDSFIDTERPIVTMDQPTTISLGSGPTFEDIGTVIGSGPTLSIDPPRHDPVKLAARMVTSESALKPPYPNDKRRAEEEATLRLKLTIDARGRVTAVEPVVAADASFLEAARRHILRAWRYKPATEDGVAVPSSTVITLSFRLEDV